MMTSKVNGKAEILSHADSKLLKNIETKNGLNDYDVIIITITTAIIIVIIINDSKIYCI